MNRPIEIRIVVAAIAAIAAAASFASAARGAETIDYLRQIKPLLASKCYSCHGALRQESALRLETRELMIRGGDNGAVIRPGQPEESLLVERIIADDESRMPPADEGGALTADEIRLLKTWISQGAEAPHEATPSDPRKHWAYQKPERPVVPRVPNQDWVRNPIDAFLAFEQVKDGVTPVQPADDATLLRRVHLDLVGLPPTRKQLDAFLSDNSGQAFENVVEELLESPGYGERWGRHWMDVWRYSDWSGYRNEVRNSHRHIWRWRDWIVESLNEDKPYDQMVVEMLAGDEIAPTDPATIRATGFLARNWFLFNRDTWLDSTIEHTSKAFLGLTMNCTKCHDHKYDPIPHVDYYRMRAFFEPHHVRIDSVPGETNLDTAGLARVFDAEPDAPTYVYEQGDSKKPDKSRVIEPGVPEVLAFVKPEPVPIELPPESFQPAIRPHVLDDYLKAAQTEVASARAAVEKAKKAQETPAQNMSTASLEAERTVAEAALVAAELRVVAISTSHEADSAKSRGKAKSASALVAAAALAARRYEEAKARHAVALAEKKLLTADDKGKTKAETDLKAAQDKASAATKAIDKPGETYESLRASLRSKSSYNEAETPRLAPFARTSTGRRTSLARWIVHRDNPLTARVAVNHIWLRHFGAPLVDNVFDFGLRSPQPRHHALLDWLAVELMDRGWSMKHLHRLIVTSNAYRMSSASQNAPEANIHADRDNRLFWRMNSRRLEAEAVRDGILHVAGELDTTAGGPEVDYRQGQTNKRRSMYFQTAYEKQMKFLVIFDEASVNECYRRTESVVPHHALAMSNSALSFDQSRLLAGKLSAELTKNQGGSPENPDENLDSPSTSDSLQVGSFVRLAFLQVLSREPTRQELEKCVVFLKEQAAQLADPKRLTPFGGAGGGKVKPSPNPEQRARENLVHVLMNHTDFVTIR